MNGPIKFENCCFIFLDVSEYVSQWEHKHPWISPVPVKCNLKNVSVASHIRAPFFFSQNDLELDLSPKIFHFELEVIIIIFSQE